MWSAEPPSIESKEVEYIVFSMSTRPFGVRLALRAHKTPHGRDRMAFRNCNRPLKLDVTIEYMPTSRGLSCRGWGTIQALSAPDALAIARWVADR